MSAWGGENLSHVSYYGHIVTIFTVREVPPSWPNHPPEAPPPIPSPWRLGLQHANLGDTYITLVSSLYLQLLAITDLLSVTIDLLFFRIEPQYNIFRETSFT